MDLRHASWNKAGVPCVNIVESPSSEDLIMERQEGVALQEALRLAQVPCRHYLATNKETFRLALDFIAKERHHNPQPIVLHISCHGNDAGIGLTNGEFFSWDELHCVLLDFAYKALAYSEEAKISSVILCMSACMGIAAFKLNEKQHRPFMTLVGSTHDVYWSDSLISFLTFYNLFLVRNASAPEAVWGMNAATGIKNLFHVIDFSNELKSIVTNKSE